MVGCLKEDIKSMESLKKKWYRVDAPDNYYDEMVAYLVFESDNTMMLEFRMNEPLGGTQRVMFFKEQLVYDGEY